MFDSFIAGAIAMSVGVLANLLFSKFSETQKSLTKRVEEIAETAASKATEAKSKLAEETLKHHPELAQIHSAGGDINITIESNERVPITLSGDPLVQDLVNGYHQQALSQAKVQFWFSIAAATIGFVYRRCCINRDRPYI